MSQAARTPCALAGGHSQGCQYAQFGLTPAGTPRYRCGGCKDVFSSGSGWPTRTGTSSLAHQQDAAAAHRRRHQLAPWTRCRPSPGAERRLPEMKLPKAPPSTDRRTTRSAGNRRDHTTSPKAIATADLTNGFVFRDGPELPGKPGLDRGRRRTAKLGDHAKPQRRSPGCQSVGPPSGQGRPARRPKKPRSRAPMYPDPLGAAIA